MLMPAVDPAAGDNRDAEEITAGRSPVPAVGPGAGELSLSPHSAHMDLLLPDHHDCSRRCHARSLRWSQ